MEKRNLSLSEYLDILQEEYLITKFRRSIYPAQTDKLFFEKVMKMKQDKIENISTKLKIDTIFNNSKLFDSVRSKIFNYLNQPIFGMNSKDEYYYYYKGSDFITVLDRSKCKIIEHNSSERNVLIRKNETNEEFIVQYSEIYRIMI